MDATTLSIRRCGAIPEDDEDDEQQEQSRPQFRRKFYETFVNVVGLTARGTPVCLSFAYRPYLFIQLKRELQKDSSECRKILSYLSELAKVPSIG